MSISRARDTLMEPKEKKVVGIHWVAGTSVTPT